MEPMQNITFEFIIDVKEPLPAMILIEEEEAPVVEELPDEEIGGSDESLNSEDEDVVPRVMTMMAVNFTKAEYGSDGKPKTRKN